MRREPIPTVPEPEADSSTDTDTLAWIGRLDASLRGLPSVALLSQAFDEIDYGLLIVRPDGLLVQNGQPYEFTGYVDGYDEKIASVEFSLDRGETWTKYDIGDMDRNKMVWWSFTYKPELEGAYCLTVRATTESGMTSFETQTVMFNAKDKMPNPEDTTVLESASLIPPKVAAASDEKSE